MDIIRFNRNNMPSPSNGLTLALGEFDGLHIGHRSLVLLAAYQASSYSGILLFANHYKGKGNKFLTSIDDKLDLLKTDRLDYAYVLEEDDSIYELSPEEFIKEILLPLGTKKVVVGPDYRFGKMAKGDIELLKRYFEVIVVPFVEINGHKVSSSLIKEELAKGKVEEAKEELGHPFSIKGKTKEGAHIGRGIGFPTLNLDFDPNYVLPKRGVYFALAYFKGRYYKAIVNVGIKPTVGGTSPSIEAYLFGYEGTDDYGYSLHLGFIRFRREEIKFASLEDLQKQIESDKEWAMKLEF